jgi:hypothetical protein
MTDTEEIKYQIAIPDGSGISATAQFRQGCVVAA